MVLPPLPPLVWPSPPRRYVMIGALIFICSLIELTLIAADFGLIGTRRWRMLWLQNGAFWAGLLTDWEPNYPSQPWLMFATYAFLHAGVMHLLGNMLALAWIGPYILQRLGQRGFALLWILTACGGALGFAVMSNAPAPMVGASGSIFGLLGALVALDYLERGAIRAVINMTFVLILMNVAMLVLERGSLAWETHLGGYLTGLLVIAVLNPKVPE
ncbi:MAG: rhomboid family intramembrane serine protease [Aliishimia sp.]